MTQSPHSLARAGLIPTEFGKLINMEVLRLGDNKLTGTPLAHFALFGLVHHENYRPFALAGEIKLTQLSRSRNHLPAVYLAK